MGGGTVRSQRLSGAPSVRRFDIDRRPGPFGPSVARVLQRSAGHHHLLVLRGEWTEDEHAIWSGCFGVASQGRA